MTIDPLWAESVIYSVVLGNIFGYDLSKGVEIMPEREALAKYLKEYRKQNNETQFEFSANIGISIEELSLLEREKGNPNLSTLQKIAAYTGAPVSELLDLEDD